MLPSSHRLNSKQYERVFKKGRHLDERILAWRVLENNVSHPRFGLLITKKQIKLATGRNAYRRMIFQIFRETSFELPTSFDFILLSRSPLIKMKAQELTPLLQNSLRNISQKLQTYEQKK